MWTYWAIGGIDLLRSLVLQRHKEPFLRPFSLSYRMEASGDVDFLINRAKREGSKTAH